MATIMPEGEELQKAIKWVSMNLEEKSDQPLQKLVEKAVFKFDLSPVDTEFLLGFFKKMKANS
jgi:hypothetical protein